MFFIDNVISWIYANRVPQESYRDTILRLKHPLSEHLLHDSLPAMQELDIAITKANVALKSQVVVLNDFAKYELSSKKISTIPLQDFEAHRNRGLADMLDYWQILPAEGLVKVRLRADI